MTATIVNHPSSEQTPKGTTNETVAQDLRASLAARRGVFVGPTFGDFVQACRQLGITDDMSLSSIEYGVVQGGTSVITVDVDHCGIEIREGR